MLDLGECEAGELLDDGCGALVRAVLERHH